MPFGAYPNAVFMAFLAWVLATSIVLVRDKDDDVATRQGGR